jgi:hypothetical protein
MTRHLQVSSSGVQGGGKRRAGGMQPLLARRAVGEAVGGRTRQRHGCGARQSWATVGHCKTHSKYVSVHGTRKILQRFQYYGSELVAAARMIEFLVCQGGHDVDIQLRPIILTYDQCNEYQLPRTPIKARCLCS